MVELDGSASCIETPRQLESVEARRVEPDVLEVPRIHRGYPAEKPVDVSRILIGQSSNEGDIKKVSNGQD